MSRVDGVGTRMFADGLVVDNLGAVENGAGGLLGAMWVSVGPFKL